MFGPGEEFEGSQLIQAGLKECEGAPIFPVRLYYITLRALPMGCAWSCWLVQAMHDRLAQGSVFKGIGSRDCPGPVRGGLPGLQLQGRRAACPVYCDNLNVFPLDAHSCQRGLDSARGPPMSGGRPAA